MNVGLYARVSTPGQDPAPQLAKMREWAARMGHRVAFEYTEVASGRKAARPQQAALMARARGRHVDAVVVVKVDRWARSTMHLSATVHELHALGVSFVAIDQGLTVDPRDPTAKLILGVLGAVAEWEASIISERTRDGLVGKAGKGRHPNACGVAFPCPSGAHPKKGIPSVQEAPAPESGGLPNGRLPCMCHTGDGCPLHQSVERGSDLHRGVGL